MGRVLIGLGVFMLFTAVLLRFYAYDQLAVVPKNQETVSTLVGPGATVFDQGTLEEIQTDLTTSVLTVGQVEVAEEAGDDVVVFDSSTSTRTSDGDQISATVDRVAFDAHSGMAVDCCDTFVSAEEGVASPVRREGLLIKFPFQTEKRAYDWWDDDLGETVPIDYVGEDELDGLTVYLFEQQIEPTIVDSTEVPASLMGLDEEGNVQGDLTYSNVRRLWVEPETGVIIKRTEDQFNTIAYQGEDQITTTAVTTGYDDATVDKNVSDYSSKASQLVLVRTTLPLILLVGGLVLIGVGAISMRRKRARA